MLFLLLKNPCLKAKAMNVNPFDKSYFATHREWEEALLVFLENEAKSPDVKHWNPLTNEDQEIKKTAGFCALLLCNLIGNKDAWKVNSLTVRSISKELLGLESVVEEYGVWLKSGWVSVSRLSDMLNQRLRS